MVVKKENIYKAVEQQQVNALSITNELLKSGYVMIKVVDADDASEAIHKSKKEFEHKHSQPTSIELNNTPQKTFTIQNKKKSFWHRDVKTREILLACVIIYGLTSYSNLITIEIQPALAIAVA